MQLPSQLEHESPGGKAILSRFIHFQGQLVLASLTFTTDSLVCWVFTGGYVSFIAIHSSTYPTFAPRVMSIVMAGGREELSAGRRLQGGGEI